ncbi:MAG: hypothetical protein WED00_13910 [Aquisalimonadaceae bacterium]
MDCNTVRQHIDALRGHRLPADIMGPVEDHLRHCRACRAFETDLGLLRHGLATMTPPTMPADLAERSLRPLRRRHHMPTALAASVMLTVAVLAGLFLGIPRQAADPGVAGPDGWQTRTIQLALDAPEPMDAVRFRLELPESVEVQGHPGRRTLEWTDNLAAGPNRLSIPIVLMDGANGELLARLEHGGRIRELRVPTSSLAR